jgi:hypothetical protein
MRWWLFWALVVLGCIVSANLKAEEVEVVFTDQGGELINEVLGLTWTHALIRFPGEARYYEATWPRVCRSKALKGHSHKVFILEANAAEVAKMKAYADSRLGVRYNFWGYFFPVLYGQTRGVYCSQYVNNILRAGGVPLRFGDGYDPDCLLDALRGIYEH